MEIGQLQAACDLLRRYEGIEPEEILPAALPDTPVTFEPNKDYVREILATQIDLRDRRPRPTSETPTCPTTTAPVATGEVVNAGGAPASWSSTENRSAAGPEFRDETEGPNPVPELQSM